jgi:tetratricopeptide (TPR) repeat protein
VQGKNGVFAVPNFPVDFLSKCYTLIFFPINASRYSTAHELATRFLRAALTESVYVSSVPRILCTDCGFIEMNYYDQEALLQRLSIGLRKRFQEVVFLVGAPLSAPSSAKSPGVPSVGGIIDLIRREFEGNTRELELFEREVTSSGLRKYQAAFMFLQGRRGQATANEIIRNAVLAAREPGALKTSFDPSTQSAFENACQLLDSDIQGWHLNPGLEKLGKLAADYSKFFGNIILTTNFDPLLEISIQRAGGRYWRTSLYADGNLIQTQATGCHVVHLHGFWHGADTLHTPQQLRQERPYLKGSLKSLLRDKLVVVCAYGGWDDIFTNALIEVVRDVSEYPEVLWTFFAEQPNADDPITEQLLPGIDRGRVTLYKAIDCNTFFPALHNTWSGTQEDRTTFAIGPSNPVRVSESVSSEVRKERTKPSVLEGDDEDHPPRVDIYVGRDAEMELLRGSSAKLVFITGIGGQGKSSLAAQYFSDCQRIGKFSLFVWRDCKEETERFENQLCSVIEKLSNGKVSGKDLGAQSAESIVQVFLSAIANQKALFTFDNVDHFADRETGSLTGISHLFVTALMKSALQCQVVFTCRPAVNYEDPNAISVRLEGLGLEPTFALFSQRGAVSSTKEIAAAHERTAGHAFWLDLLAIQVAKQNSETSLRAMLNKISESGYLPEQMLRSIWETLKPQEQTVLRSMAEALKPATEVEISDYLSGELTYKKVMKALRNLRVLNLVVIKKREGSSDLLELHPLVRTFIRTSFAQGERLSFINRILAVYTRFIDTYKGQLKERPSLVVLQNWTHSAELDTAAGKFNEAFATLAAVARPFQGSGYPREFTRTVRALLEASDWTVNHQGLKRFEAIFRPYIHFLVDMGEDQEVDDMLEKYEMSLRNKDWHYVSYCDLRCYSKWARGDFVSALQWGKKAQSLQTEADADKKINTSHNLALAERDAGRPEVAVSTFLGDRTLPEVIDPEELDESSPGDYYGNIGRCLHLMGQLDGALACYQKSAILLEKAREQHIVNQGYIRAWIGEMLLARGQVKLAAVFYRAAYFKWQQTAPPRAARINDVLGSLRQQGLDVDKIEAEEIEEICVDWILGGNLDSKT